MLFNINSTKHYPSLGTNGTLSLADGSTVAVALNSKYAPKVGDTFTLWDVTTLNASADGVTLQLPALPNGFAWDTSELFQQKSLLKVVAATGINQLTADTVFHCEIFKTNGARVGVLTTTKARLNEDIRGLHVEPGLYLVKVGATTMKVLVK